MVNESIALLLAFVRNWASGNVFKLFYEEGHVELYIYDDKIKKVRKVAVPTIKEIIKSSVGIDDLITGAYVAGEDIPKYHLVYFNPEDFKIYKASKKSKDTAKVLGMVTKDVKENESVNVVSSGTVTLDYDLVYNPNDTLYLHINGQFTNELPDIGEYITRIGKVISSREIDLDIGDPIYNAG
jgi:hypothetical protein